MGTRFATTGPEGPQLGASDAANLRTQFNALVDMVDLAITGTFVISDPTLAIGTSSKKAVKNAAFSFQANGVTEAKAAAETAFTATTHDIADGSARAFTLSIATGGTVTITPGTAAVGTTATAPATPAGEAKMGEVLIAASGAIFNATTDDLDAAHLTVTYTDYNYAAQLKTVSDLTRN